VLPNGQTVAPLNLFKPGSTLWLTLTLKLATFNNTADLQQCQFNPQQVSRHAEQHAVQALSKGVLADKF
jgi:hypothetical protein